MQQQQKFICKTILCLLYQCGPGATSPAYTKWLAGYKAALAAPAVLSTSQQGVDFIKSHEGYSSTPYKVTASGNPTIGYGHEITGKENPVIGSQITRERCRATIED